MYMYKHTHTRTHTHTHTHNTYTWQAPVRDHMLAQFTTQASSAGRTPDELVKLKCKLVSSFSTNLSRVFSSISLRSQLIQLYDNILHLLSGFPVARDSHFILGKQLEFGIGGLGGAGTNSKSSLRNLCLNPGGLGDPRQHLARPFALLSKDGGRLMNLWYIPHYTEVSEREGYVYGHVLKSACIIFFADFSHVC